MARKKKCCVRRKRGRDGRMHCAKWKPPSSARKCVAPKYGTRKAAPRKGRRRARKVGGSTELRRVIGATSRQRCSNPRREAKLFAIGNYIMALGQMEASHGVGLRGVRNTQRKVNGLKRQFLTAKKAVQKCAGRSAKVPGTSMSR